MSHRNHMTVALLLSAVVPSVVRAAGLNPCSQAIAVATEGYVATKQKTIATCEDNKSKGKLAADVNCRPADGAVTDPATDKKLAAAAAKVQAQIGAKCTTLPPLGPACDSATTAAALADCITATTQDADVEAINVDTLIAAVYNTATPITDAGIEKCQATIAKEGGAYLATRMKAHRACETKRAGGKVSACPDAAAGKALDKARAKFAANIKKKCSDTQVTTLTFGGACEHYLYLTFKRDGASNNNSVGAADSLVGCMADAHAGVADRMAAIGLPGTEASAFSFGVAAGDATDTSVVFWTRVPNGASAATLEVATDAKFTAGLQSFQGSTVTDGDNTVKIDVSGLSPATVYYYRFKQGSNVSPIGRVVTAPEPTDTTRTVRLAWSGDSNAYNQPFTALDPMRLLNPDAFLYIGDTIYGDDPLADGIVAHTVSEYHGKYRSNRADAPLRSILAATGTYVEPDDHEVRNDYAGAVPAYAARMAAGNFAFRRNFPLREDGTDPMKLYRSFQWGSGAEFFLIDDRQYRSAKYTCCSDSAKSGFVTTDGDGSAGDSTCGGTPGEALVPSPACASAMAGASRTVLGAAQKQWLKDGLMHSSAAFKFIMNGPPITQLAFLPYDRWEAWTAERNELLDFIQNNHLKNVVWLSTDFHAAIISGQRVDATHSVPELVCGSIGEQTIFRELPASVEGLLPQLPSILTQITEYNIDRYNGVLISVTPGSPATATFDFYDRTGAVIHSVSYTAS